MNRRLRFIAGVTSALIFMLILAVGCKKETETPKSAKAYLVEVASSTSGDVAVDPFAAQTTGVKANQLVTLTLTPTGTNEVGSVTIKNAATGVPLPSDAITFTSATTCTFLMPAYNVLIEVEFVPPQPYKIILETMTGGSVSISPSAALDTGVIKDTPITVTITPEGTNELHELHGSYTGGNVTFAGSGYDAGATRTFNMPAANVTISATFGAVRPKHAITATVNGSGVIEAPTESPANEIITVRLKANSSNVIDSPALTFNPASIVPSAAVIVDGWSQYTFTMPDQAVSVTGNFKSSGGPVVETGGPLSYDSGKFTLDVDLPSGTVYAEVYRGRSRLDKELRNNMVGYYMPADKTFVDPSPNEKKYENYYFLDCLDAGGNVIATLGPYSLEQQIFGSSVKFYDGNYDNIDTMYNEINAIHDNETSGRVFQSGIDGSDRKGEFSSLRYAMYLKPGEYNKSTAGRTLKIGFYTSLLGLGKTPGDTVLFNLGIDTPTHLDPTPGDPNSANNATCTFWRSIENVRIRSGAGTFQWGVSQSAPVRRVHVECTTKLDVGGYCSGGYIADSRFDAGIGSSPQQQYYFRNNHFSSFPSGVNWNKVVQANSDTSATHNEAGKVTRGQLSVIPNSPSIREKPFLFIDDDGEYKVFRPALKTNSTGPNSWSVTGTGNSAVYSMGDGTVIDFISEFYVTNAPDVYGVGGDTADIIQAKLDAGKHIFLSPGRYTLNKPLRITKPDTIFMGYGYTTLLPAVGNNNGCLFVEDVPGVTVAGIMFDATDAYSTYLMSVGETGANANHASNPTVLYDNCLRVGGGHFKQRVHTDVALLINSNNVIMDKTWVWRADHGDGGVIDWHMNTSKNGLVVRGNDVIAYGMFVEHFHEYNVLWMGDRGRLYFFQNETPYDPHYQASYRSHGGTVNGYAMYKVDNRVNEHYAIGLGMYSVFLNRTNGCKERILIASAVEVPNKPGVRILNPCIVRLGSQAGGISSIVNGTGNSSVDAYSERHIREYTNGTATLTGNGDDNGPTAGTAPADETHWIEDLVINSQGVSNHPPSGGRASLTWMNTCCGGTHPDP